MEPQLYMWSGTRQIFAERHRFYADQIRQRVLSQFQKIDEEAEHLAETEYERLGNLPYAENDDMSSAAEQAQDAATNLYMLLDDLRKQTMFGALAGMYHQWEKELRDFLEHELRHAVPLTKAKEMAWKNPRIDKSFDLLEAFGWALREAAWFSKLEACRLVVKCL